MRLSTIKFALMIWAIAETVVFVLIAETIGVPEALLLGLLTSVLGWTLLKRAGASAMTKLRAAIDGRRIVEGDRLDVLDDTLATFGAFALMVPGFVSDVLGLVLSVPAARDRVSRWVGGRGGFAAFRTGGRQSPRGPSTIDLAPGEWEHDDAARQPLSKT